MTTPKNLHWRGADIVYWRYSTTSGYRLLREACLVCRRPVGRWTYLGSETGCEFWGWAGKISQNSGERWLRVIESCTKDEEVQTASDGKSLVYKSQSHQAKKEKTKSFQLSDCLGRHLLPSLRCCLGRETNTAVSRLACGVKQIIRNTAGPPTAL